MWESSIRVSRDDISWLLVTSREWVRNKGKIKRRCLDGYKRGRLIGVVVCTGLTVFFYTSFP